MNSFTVSKIDGCTLVIGPVPAKEFLALTMAADRSALLSPHLARLAGASFAWGLPEDVSALEKKLTDRASAGKGGLDLWLAVGQHGASSLAIVHHLTARRVADDPRAHPHDPADLARCVKLLEAAPELRASFELMRDLSPTWAALVQHWDELEGMLNAESPAWREAKGSAPMLYTRMRELIAGAVQ